VTTGKIMTWSSRPPSAPRWTRPTYAGRCARITAAAGLDSTAWTPRELRHSFVSLLSNNGVALEDIADLCGHAGTSVTEKVYRHELRPVLLTGAVAMDRIFADDDQKK
jgi:integrase